MKKLFTNLAAVALSVGALGIAQNAAALDTRVQFDPTGAGDFTLGTSITDIISFDWKNNQSIIIEQNYVSATGTAGAICNGVNPTLSCFFGVAAVGDTLTFDLHASAALDSFSGGLPVANTSPDISGFQVTGVLNIRETAVVESITAGSIKIAFTGVSGTYTFYTNDTITFNPVTGAGYTDGAAFITGNVVKTEGDFAGPNGLGASGTGSSFLTNTITSYNSGFLEADDPDCPTPGTCLIGTDFDSTLNLDFGLAPQLAVGGLSGGTYTYLAGDLKLAGDPTTQFTRIPVPVPGTVLLLGMGLLGLVGSRRRG